MPNAEGQMPNEMYKPVEIRLGEDAKRLQTPEERVRLWRELIASHPRREGVHLDDSRDGIYDRSDDAAP
jgi:hypothetical protein